MVVLAFWNRRSNAACSPQVAFLQEGCEAGCPAPDLLMLAEVTQRAAAALHPLGATVGPDFEESTGGGAHGVMALARHGDGITYADRSTLPNPVPIELPSKLDTYLKEQAPSATGQPWNQPRPLRPERWLAVRWPEASGLTVAAMHLPYAAGSRVWDTTQNRLTKQQAYQQLMTWASDRTSTVVALDGNNTRDWLEPSDDVPRPPKPRRSLERRWLDEADLFAVEDEFHGPGPSHGMVDSLRVAALEGTHTFHDPHGTQAAAKHFDRVGSRRPLAVTYRLKNDGHRMDRIYVSPDLESRIKRAGVCHHEVASATIVGPAKPKALCCGSDHALVWVEVDL